MNRARAGLPRGPLVRLLLRLGPTLVAAALVGACGVTTTPSDSGQASAPPSASVAVTPATPAVTSPPASADPSSPSGAPSPSPASSAPAAACSGNDDNRDFFASFAEAVEWDVYCPVLPAGWFVESGTYRLSGGAWMEIVYRGPSEARFGLREGAFCREEGDCVPSGTDVGAAAFGDREGTIVAADDGSWAITVDRGLSPSWLATGSGLDEAGFREHAEGLALVGG